MKKIAVMITNYNMVEVDAETEEEAIEKVKNQLEPRVAAVSAFDIVHETAFDEESQTYKVI